MTDMRVISADSHMTEPGDLWVTRLDQKYRDQPDENDVVVATHKGAPPTRIPSAANYIGPDWGKGKATPKVAPSLLFQPKAGRHGFAPPGQPCRC